MTYPVIQGHWSNTQLGGKYPVMLGYAREVGEITESLENEETSQVGDSNCMSTSAGSIGAVVLYR